MPRWLDRAVDRAVDRVVSSYMKRRSDRVTPSFLFGGEAPLGSTSILGEDLTTVQRSRLAVTSSWIWSDIATISNIASATPFDVYQKEGESTIAIVDHAFEQLMRVPNEEMDGEFLLKYSFWWQLLQGESYWLLVDDSAGELVEMWPLPSSRMRPIPDAQEYIAGYLYTPRHGQKPRRLAKESVMFWRQHPNPFDYHRGMTPMTAYYAPMETDLKAAAWNRDTFDKELALKTLFLLKNVEGGDFEALKAEILQELQEKGRRFWVAHADDVDVTQWGLTKKDMEFLAGRAFSRDEIDRVFGIPAGYWSEKSNRANSEAADVKFIGGAVWPPLKSSAGAITTQILVPRYGADILGQFQDIRPRDRRLQVVERKTYWPVTKLNEARDELGKKEYDGPLADVIGELPVALATNPQFVMAMVGMGAQGVPVGQVSAEAKADLRRWRSIERRRFREGEEPGSYEFTSDCLPPDVMAEVKAALEGAVDVAAVDEAFDVELARAPAAPGVAVNREQIELAVLTGVSPPKLWPKLGLFTGDELVEMTEEFGRLDAPLWEPERMAKEEGEDGEAGDNDNGQPGSGVV